MFLGALVLRGRRRYGDRLNNRRINTHEARRLLRQAIVIGLLSLFAAGCPVLSPKPAGDIRYSLALPDTNIAYSMYAPPWYTPTETWPLMITLHGTYGYDGHRRQVREFKKLD